MPKTKGLLERYRGKIMLIVNTATKCIFTPQYKALQYLFDKYHDQGLEILDFPCNQFAKSTPGTPEEIEKFCAKNYQTTFDRFARSTSTATTRTCYSLS
jgi:glutathione peroxidase